MAPQKLRKLGTGHYLTGGGGGMGGGLLILSGGSLFF